MPRKSLAIALAALAGLAACGETTGQQALIGGAAGAGTAAVVNGNLLAGAAVGAGANVLYCQENPQAC